MTDNLFGGITVSPFTIFLSARLLYSMFGFFNLIPPVFLYHILQVWREGIQGKFIPHP